MLHNMRKNILCVLCLTLSGSMAMAHADAPDSAIEWDSSENDLPSQEGTPSQEDTAPDLSIELDPSATKKTAPFVTFYRALRKASFTTTLLFSALGCFAGLATLRWYAQKNQAYSSLSTIVFEIRSPDAKKQYAWIFEYLQDEQDYKWESSLTHHTIHFCTLKAWKRWAAYARMHNIELSTPLNLL